MHRYVQSTSTVYAEQLNMDVTPNYHYAKCHYAKLQDAKRHEAKSNAILPNNQDFSHMSIQWVLKELFKIPLQFSVLFSFYSLKFFSEFFKIYKFSNTFIKYKQYCQNRDQIRNQRHRLRRNGLLPYSIVWWP